MTETQREWRLYIVAAVAGVYVLAWSQITPTLRAKAPAAQPRAVWLDDLPREQRPAVLPPAGWRVADRSQVVAPVPRRVPAPSARIRTRSS